MQAITGMSNVESLVGCEQIASKTRAKSVRGLAHWGRLQHSSTLTITPHRVCSGVRVTPLRVLIIQEKGRPLPKVESWHLNLWRIVRTTVGGWSRDKVCGVGVGVGWEGWEGGGLEGVGVGWEGGRGCF